MSFQSILFENPRNIAVREREKPPDYFVDLNLDQVVRGITAGKEEYHLTPLFHVSLSEVEHVEYRHEVMRDLAEEKLLGNINVFARTMKRVRAYLARSKNEYNAHAKNRWFLDGVALYCEAVRRLAEDLSDASLESRGFNGLADYLSRYTNAPPFETLFNGARQIQYDLGQIRYSVHIHGPAVSVRRYDGETDYSADVEATFRKFQQGAVKDYRQEFKESDSLDGVEARILDCVAEVFSDIFLRLEEFCAANADFIDSTITTFDREVQFYVSCLDYIARFRAHALDFCLPEVSPENQEIWVRDTFDAALAWKLIAEEKVVVQNDFHLSRGERIIVVSGPNQGGKTTFARAFGQLHFLASLGCQVPGSTARLPLFDRLLTHFEKAERVENVRGKLEDDLLRIHHVLDVATPHSIVIMNEIFNSTTLEDAIFLGERVMQRLVELDLIGVCVTFIDELASLSEKVVSMASTVVPHDPAERTFKIMRKPADGIAYAISVAEKYELTYDNLKERLEL